MSSTSLTTFAAARRSPTGSTGTKSGLRTFLCPAPLTPPISARPDVGQRRSATMTTIRFERDGAIGNIVLANPPFNRLDLPFAEALRKPVHQAGERAHRGL